VQPLVAWFPSIANVFFLLGQASLQMIQDPN
jgi:hypothetical protein